MYLGKNEENIVKSMIFLQLGFFSQQRNKGSQSTKFQSTQVLSYINESANNK